MVKALDLLLEISVSLLAARDLDNEPIFLCIGENLAELRVLSNSATPA